MQKKEKKRGLIAGVSLIIMAVAAGFAYGYVHNRLIMESAEITFQHLQTNKTLFISGLAAWVIIFITDLIVAVNMFLFYRSTDRVISMLTAILRIIYTLVLGVAIAHLFKVLPMLNWAIETGEISPAYNVVEQINQFEKIWSIGLIIFGFHLVGLGYLSYKSTFTPRILAILLYIAGVSYVLIHTLHQLANVSPKEVDLFENLLSIPMALGELLLAAWLIYYGLKKYKR